MLKTELGERFVLAHWAVRPFLRTKVRAPVERARNGAYAVSGVKARISRELLFRRLGNLQLRLAGVFDFHGRDAFQVLVIVAKLDGARELKLVLGELAILYPELDGALGVLRPCFIGAATTEREQLLSA